MNGRRQVPLVTGSTGRLGEALQERMAEAYPAAIFATRDELDITDRWRLESEIERLQPTVVVNAAAITDVDGCEDRPEIADEINHVGAENVAKAAGALGTRVIQISTDLVFDGALKRRYTEDDPPAPLSVYGRSKLLGEEAVRAAAPGSTILRSSWFFGSGVGGFPGRFLAQIEEGSPLGLVADRRGSPTFIPDLAEAITRLIEIPFDGVLHFTNAGDMTTRYHLVFKAASMLKLDTSSLRPLSHLAWKGDRAPRPLNSALDPSRFIALTGWTPPTWEQSLESWARSRRPGGA
ncbi:MAG TPA: NAD(P)-dependent oxidoreductase [Candidatus Saccharimonadales bacterium]|nr:NAD(P)-dependent oxidoreductase [Candidatus Saccharimonadales bacterium]